jgi:hypothetical protein
VAQRREVLAVGKRLEHASAHCLEVRPECDQDLRRDPFALANEAEEDVLSADVVVTERQRLRSEDLFAEDPWSEA